MSEAVGDYTVTMTEETCVSFLTKRIAALEAQWATMMTDVVSVAELEGALAHEVKRNEVGRKIHWHRMDDINARIDALGQPMACTLETMESETPAAVLKEIGELKDRVRDLEECRRLQIETNANWFARMRLLEARAKDMGIRMDDAERSIGDVQTGADDDVPSDKIAVITGALFEQLLAAGADTEQATLMVRDWLRYREVQWSV